MHLFGAASSPACSNFALRKTAEDSSEHFPEAVVNTVKKNFYVDDCLKSLPSVEEASQHASDLRCLLSRGGFRLTKWISNSRGVLETIPECERAKEVKTLDLSKDDLPVERALGVVWCVETDTFGFKVHVKLKSPTRRGILSVVSSAYDPLGLAAPFVLPAKQLFQDLCRVTLEWDDPIPPDHKVCLERWMAELPNYRSFLSRVVLNRLVSTLSRPVSCTIFRTPPKSDSDPFPMFASSTIRAMSTAPFFVQSHE